MAREVKYIFEDSYGYLQNSDEWASTLKNDECKRLVGIALDDCRVTSFVRSGKPFLRPWDAKQFWFLLSEKEWEDCQCKFSVQHAVLFAEAIWNDSITSAFCKMYPDKDINHLRADARDLLNEGLANGKRRLNGKKESQYTSWDKMRKWAVDNAAIEKVEAWLAGVPLEDIIATI